MADEESSSAWLHSALMRVCSDQAALGLQLDSDTVASLVCYCELATPADAAEYIVNIVGHELCVEIVEEYLKRRTTPPTTIKSSTGTPLQAYQKPQEESTWSAGGKNASRAGKQKVASGREANPAAAAAAPTSSTKAASSRREKASSGRAKKGVTVAEASKMILNPGKPCDCQATRHELVNNCLSCGKIVCQQEGEGPCSFCGALVLKEGSAYAGLEGSLLPTSEAEAAAQAFKDRLVEYDRNSASRTTVIDDQSDFFEIEGDSWVSEQEKQLLRKKQKEFEMAEEERKKRVVVTIDLLGRKVVMAGGPEEATVVGSSNSASLATAHDREKTFRVKASPDVRELPVYVNTESSRDRANKSKAASTSTAAVTGRVQYQDEFTEALLGRKMELLEIDTAPQHKWQQPRLMEGSSAFEEASQSFECA
ncbi:activating signal cointegrator 1-like [Selaginella moellendorffii]|uniref:activating signal cointegrator 1-like n=1 Tax=Selaginella moellendorffii TaxID=88036 RepID=UPI000D1C6D77|nr:activating signal cointegrator 1-like [Selaginella moellendorffii]|eukprot:XP_024537080.1 activating signal cointegrator 1-like [Selaginella moellendorffii]